MHAARDFSPSAAAALNTVGGVVFDPLQLSAVTAWLRLAAGTITGSGYSSVPDVLASNPATQGTDASRPPNVNTTGGFPQADFTNGPFLSWPTASNNNQTSAWGVALWLSPDIVTGSHGIICSRVGSATDRIEIMQSSADFFVDIYISQFSSRRATITSFFSAGTRFFFTLEYNGAGADDSAKCTITKNAVVQSPTFSDSAGAPGAMPASLVSAGNPYIIGARTTAPLQPFDGKMGPNIWTLGSVMTGATQGLLTTGARSNLMNFEST
jgi:hypothetical protein